MIRTSTLTALTVTYILRATEEKGMTQDEIEANAQILIMAGSETTASALSGMYSPGPEKEEAMWANMICINKAHSSICSKAQQLCRSLERK